MIRIPLENITNSTSMIDIKGKKRNIRDRTVRILNAIIDTINFKLNSVPTKLYKHIVTNSKNNCLLKTYTYTLESSSIYTPKMTFPTFDYHYAIYLYPNIINVQQDPFLAVCNKPLGGIHIKLVGHHPQNPDPTSVLIYLSQLSPDDWTINDSTISVNQNIIFFNSFTLNKIADFFYLNKFQNIKGPNYTGNKWFISADCYIPENIFYMLRQLTWSYMIVNEYGNQINFINGIKYPVKML